MDNGNDYSVFRLKDLEKWSGGDRISFREIYDELGIKPGEPLTGEQQMRMRHLIKRGHALMLRKPATFKK